MAMDTDEQADCVASPVSHSACDSRDFRDGSVVGKRLDESRGETSDIHPFYPQFSYWLDPCC